MHSKAVDEAETKYRVKISEGLSSAEAAKRLKKNGNNILKDKKKKSIVFLFFEQFNDFLIIVLIAAACISFITNIMENSGDVAEPIVIMAIVIINALLGVIQECRAEKSLEKLKKMTMPNISVIRDGKETVVPVTEAVVGDVAIIRTGDVVGADMRLVKSENLEIDESALTGESVPSLKDSAVLLDEYTPLAERVNMAYSSTFVTGGDGVGIIVSTGMNTEVGKIATMISEAEIVETPLQKKLNKVGKSLGITALCICAFVFIIGVLHRLSPFNMFVTSVSLAVAAIPEGLPAIVTIMLSLGVQKMAKSGAIVRNLPAVETLGSSDVICTDKTGTLTKNKMEVQSVFGDVDLTIKYGCLCCAENTKNPTELAILKYAGVKQIRYNHMNISERVPFSSKTKQMRVMCGKLLIVKGAPEIVLRSCTEIKSEKAIIKMTALKRREIENENKKYAEDALRVIAVAFKNNARSVDDGGLVFCGLIAMSDPPRRDAAEAVKLCITAGIKPVMITGDQVQTACAIAKGTGILTGEEGVICATEIDKMSDDELSEKIENYSVVARATPKHKVRIVKAFQSKGKVVAMTGDGVNDAPALKTADIGCALGKTGTDVAKASSDIVLTDDNFASIVKAVRLGREIYENIKKSVKFLISSNIGEIVTVFISILIGLPTPLVAMQLLWVNLVTDSLPAVALGVDTSDEDLLLKGKNTGSLFSKSMVAEIVLQGLMIGCLGILSFCIGYYIYGSLTVGRTMSFCVLSLSQLVHSFNMRSDTKSIFESGIFANKMLVLSFVVGVFLQIGVVCVYPSIFGVTMLGSLQWCIVAVLSLVPLAVVELQKLINHHLFS